MKQFIEQVERLRLQSLGFRYVTDAIDTTTPQSVLVFHMFRALTKFERAVIRERTRAGLVAAKLAWRRGQSESPDFARMDFLGPRGIA